ncbi:MAG: triacylglycerol lipase [Lachnospiraceae bacterium]|nr:triacylglycerol lipase [Lachnospiraceae bacterium]
MKTPFKTPAKVLSALIILLALNIRSVCTFLFYAGRIETRFPSACAAAEIICYILILYINFFPTLTVRKVSTTRNKILEDGIALLQIFLITTVVEIVCCIAMLIIGLPAGEDTAFSHPLFWLRQFGLAFLIEFILFWNGILRVYVTSVQLGIKWRVIGAVCGLIPIVHLYVLCRIIRIAGNEVIYENEKYLLNQVRAENQECRTKYPVLLVHGVFFRDFRFFNYWGRIPAELKRNGAVLFYGSQQSAASVADCGEELATRIRQIREETGCDKVNIIAHSKGGLDSRYAISKCGAAPYVASLTTINTPHRGCIFADYLLDKIPDSVCNKVSSKYNAALTLLGDTKPDFMEAVQDLTASACGGRNEVLSDSPQVYYQSIGSRMNAACSGRFPLNMSYPMVKHFDGANDGLVSVDSMKWGSRFTCLTVPGGRGISHGDMIDLNRENIAGFDVREFYVNLVHELKERGF